MRHDVLHGLSCSTLAIAAAATVAACTTARAPAAPPSAAPRPSAAAWAYADSVYFEFQVERPVIAAPGTVGPRYPAELLARSVEGEVQAHFVVDTMGRVVPGSFKVLRSTHDLFTAAVRDALDSMRFTPARIGGRKVRQIVQQPFQFALVRAP